MVIKMKMYLILGLFTAVLIGGVFGFVLVTAINYIDSYAAFKGVVE